MDPHRSWRNVWQLLLTLRLWLLSSSMRPTTAKAALPATGWTPKQSMASLMTKITHLNFSILWFLTWFSMNTRIFTYLHHCSPQLFVSCSPSTSGFVPPLIQAVAPLTAFAWRFCEALAHYHTFSSHTIIAQPWQPWIMGRSMVVYMLFICCYDWLSWLSWLSWSSWSVDINSN